jgi:TolA-binding protein
MAFTVNDLQDLTRLLRERPEWLSEVRRIVFTEELLTLPQRTDERFAELAEAQRRNEQRFAELTEAIRQLTLRFEEAQQRNEQRFAELAEAIRQLALRFDEYRQRTDAQIADMRGKLLEIEYRNKAGAIFGSRLRRPQVIDAGVLWELLRERLDESEIRKIVTADLIVRGQLFPPQNERELWLIVEISSVIDRNDVARAASRAALLRKAGLLALPVAAGQRVTQGAAALSSQLHVVLAKNGSLAGWDVALSDALST